eukprot:4624616-Pyramimonas_sp.AAC.1
MSFAVALMRGDLPAPCGTTTRSTSQRGHHFIKATRWPAVGVARFLGSMQGAVVNGGPCRSHCLSGLSGATRTSTQAPMPTLRQMKASGT